MNGGSKGLDIVNRIESLTDIHTYIITDDR